MRLFGVIPPIAPPSNSLVSYPSMGRFVQIWLGLSVGALIGALSGIVTLMVLSPIFFPKGAGPSGKSITASSGALLGLPLFWFCGPWSVTLFQIVDLNVFLPPYILLLLVSYFVVISYPVVRWVHFVGTRLEN